jgi:hypothetical protein
MGRPIMDTSRTAGIHDTALAPGRGNAGVPFGWMRVQCYSGRKGDERPVRFELDGHEYTVKEVLDQWYGPEDTFFKVRADDNSLYILRHRPATDAWSLESFRLR